MLTPVKKTNHGLCLSRVQKVLDEIKFEIKQSVPKKVSCLLKICNFQIFLKMAIYRITGI